MKFSILLKKTHFGSGDVVNFKAMEVFATLRYLLRKNFYLISVEILENHFTVGIMVPSCLHLHES